MKSRYDQSAGHGGAQNGIAVVEHRIGNICPVRIASEVARERVLVSHPLPIGLGCLSLDITGVSGFYFPGHGLQSLAAGYTGREIGGLVFDFGDHDLLPKTFAFGLGGIDLLVQTLDLFGM